jgi:hypothetical protein
MAAFASTHASARQLLAGGAGKAQSKFASNDS